MKARICTLAVVAITLLGWAARTEACTPQLYDSPEAEREAQQLVADAAVRDSSAIFIGSVAWVSESTDGPVYIEPVSALKGVLPPAAVKVDRDGPPGPCGPTLSFLIAQPKFKQEVVVLMWSPLGTDRLRDVLYATSPDGRRILSRLPQD